MYPHGEPTWCPHMVYSHDVPAWCTHLLSPLGAQGGTGEDFDRFDWDKSGTLDRDELEALTTVKLAEKGTAMSGKDCYTKALEEVFYPVSISISVSVCLSVSQTHNVVRRLVLGICPSTSHSHSHSFTYIHYHLYLLL